MNSSESLETRANQLLEQEGPALSELRKLSIEIDDFINSSAYQELNPEQQRKYQDLYRNLMNRVRSISEGKNPTGTQTIDPGQSSQAGDIEPIGEVNRAGQTAPDHSPEAVRLMDEAEQLFYGGRYSEAIKLYDQVLGIEPRWERPRQHRAEAENYLRTGYIPSVALPPEAAASFGKAQSASRVGRYQDAQALLEKAKASLRESGIQRWQDGQ